MKLAAPKGKRKSSLSASLVATPAQSPLGSQSLHSTPSLMPSQPQTPMPHFSSTHRSMERCDSDLADAEVAQHSPQFASLAQEEL
eukprot:5567109-Prymnesium_polylepis.3